MTVEHHRYASKPTALRVDAQGADPILHPATGAVIGNKKSLVAEFAIFGPEFVPRDAEGEPLAHDQFGGPYVSASIRGHFWDSEVAQRENGWTDEETEAVIQQVEYFCQRQPDLVWRVEAPKVDAPWPTYDTQHWQEVLTTARATGQAAAALAYELQREEPRKGIVDGLRAQLGVDAEDTAAEAALTTV